METQKTILTEKDLIDRERDCEGTTCSHCKWENICNAITKIKVHEIPESCKTLIEITNYRYKLGRKRLKLDKI